MKIVILFFIRAYQLLLSPLLGSRCRFTPTCSQYATECFKEFSVMRATVLTIKRLGRCHPFSEGGYDPIPRTKLNGDDH